ncbi:hypothetical protein [Xanthomonas campestris]|uniref:hypothetical protein n=1 Tax=Xanthomonas campestris TaxID=339 RepID=UPI002366E2CD|nr:hypothetical protein [Xanthomonas campestris]WDJ06384.1 hypothetical protein JH261_01470 [Xanthomonas campestris pv. incanae]
MEGRLAGIGGQWASGIGLKRFAYLADQVLTCARHARNRCSTALQANGVRGLCAGYDFQRFEQCSYRVIDWQSTHLQMHSSRARRLPVAAVSSARTISGLGFSRRNQRERQTRGSQIRLHA